MIGDLIYEFTGGNILLLLIGVFLIFYLDSMVITILPEVLILFFFASRPETIPIFSWAVMLLIMAVIGDVSGNFSVYILFKKWKWFHDKVSHRLRKYVGFLVLKDEKLILLNRIAPALPMCGVFMAACKWNIRRSLFYIFLGGAIKYSIILFFFGFLNVYYPEETAFYITLIFVAVFLVVSFFLGRNKRRKLMAQVDEKEKSDKECDMD